MIRLKTNQSSQSHTTSTENRNQFAIQPLHLSIADFYTQTLLHTDTFTRERVAMDTSKSQFYFQFLTSNVPFVRKGCDGLTRIAILHQFLTSNVHFVRKGCVSWRSGGTAPALRQRQKEEREEICRCEGVKMQISRCDVATQLADETLFPLTLKRS